MTAWRPSTRRSARATCTCFGPEVMFRGQPHGTFKLVFNAIYAGSAAPVTLGAGKK